MRNVLADRIIEEISARSFLFAEFQMDYLKNIINSTIAEFEAEKKANRKTTTKTKTTKAVKSSKVVVFKKKGSKYEE